LKKTEVIEGLKCLINDRESFLSDDCEDDIFLEDIKVLKEAIKLILGLKVVNFELSDIGCPFCTDKKELAFLSSDRNYAVYKCQNCKSKITVKIINEIIGVETEINN